MMFHSWNCMWENNKMWNLTGDSGIELLTLDSKSNTLTTQPSGLMLICLEKTSYILQTFLWWSACLDICLRACLSIRRSASPFPIRPYTHPCELPTDRTAVHSSVRPFTVTSVRLPTILQYARLFFSMYARFSVRPPVDHLSVRSSEHGSFCPFVCPPVRPSADLFVCLSAYLYVRPNVWLLELPTQIS